MKMIKMNKKLTWILWTLFGILFIGVFVSATTTITDTFVKFFGADSPSNALQVGNGSTTLSIWAENDTIKVNVSNNKLNIYGDTLFDKNINISTLKLNQTGVYSFDKKAYARGYDVVVCRDDGTKPELNASCDITCSDGNCSDEISLAQENGNTRILLMKGIYPNVSVLLRENVTIEGEGSGKSTYFLTKIKGDGINPVFFMNGIFANNNTNLTHTIQLKNLLIVGNGAPIILNFTNSDLLKIYDSNINGGDICILLDYNGIEPPTSSSIPGGFWIHNNIILCNNISISINKQTQGWIINNWFPSGTANSISTLFINNSNKIRITNNEFDESVGVGVVIADSSAIKSSDLIFIGNWHGEGIAFNLTFLGNNQSSGNILIDDLISSGTNIGTLMTNNSFMQFTTTNQRTIDGNLLITSNHWIGITNAYENITSSASGAININARGKIQFDTDTNDNDATGTPEYNFNIAGITKATFTKSIKWGIGLSAPTETLTVQGNLSINDSGGTRKSILYVDSTNQKIGIGTSTPTQKLDVIGNTSISGGNLTIGSSTDPTNTTFFSPNGNRWKCGVDNSGVFSCVAG